ncbi:hypothetical protein WN943_015624 [Citrus x changshan-huyou]
MSLAHTPTILVAGNRLERRRLKLEKPQPKPITIVVDFVGIRLRRRLGSTPPVTSFDFRPNLSFEIAGIPQIDRHQGLGIRSFDLPPSPRVGH